MRSFHFAHSLVYSVQHRVDPERRGGGGGLSSRVAGCTAFYELWPDQFLEF